MQGKTLRRSATNQVLAGICGGIGEYFEVDPTIVRIIFIILAFATGSGIILYIILWLIIPGPTSTAQSAGEETMKEGLKEMESKFNETKDKISQEMDEGNEDIVSNDSAPKSTQKAHNWFAIALIGIGAWFLLSNWGIFGAIDLGKLWPILFIILGFYILSNRKR